MPVPLADRIQQRLDRAGAGATTDEVGRLAAYLGLLAVWNRRINLTSFRLDDPSPEAIDRLIVEPVSASRHIWPDDQTLLDLGSGGGSPAIPLKIMRPALQLTMVEARTRKAAFLREAIRALPLERAGVENDRFERLIGRWAIRGSIDLVSFRAVRADEGLWQVVRGCLASAGRILWFGAPDDATVLPSPFVEAGRYSLNSEKNSWLVIAARQPV